MLNTFVFFQRRCIWPIAVFLVPILSVRGLSGEGIELLSGGQRVAIYNDKTLKWDDRTEAWYDRSGFLHPFFTPAGRVVTSAFPKDHPHQHGLMFAWTSSQVGDHAVDFWNSHRGQGHIEHVKTIESSHDRLKVLLHHIDDTVTPSAVVLEEIWTVSTVPNDRCNVLDLQSEMTSVSDDGFHVRKYHYGGMCIRGSDAWLDHVAIETSQSKTRETANHTRPKWVSMSGETPAPFGVAAMSHPGNFRSPQHVRVHPKKPYFCFFPAVEESLSIRKGDVYRSRFRFVAYDGKPDVALLDQVYEQFAAKHEMTQASETQSDVVETQN